MHKQMYIFVYISESATCQLEEYKEISVEIYWLPRLQGFFLYECEYSFISNGSIDVNSDVLHIAFEGGGLHRMG